MLKVNYLHHFFLSYLYSFRINLSANIESNNVMKIYYRNKFHGIINICRLQVYVYKAFCVLNVNEFSQRRMFV